MPHHPQIMKKIAPYLLVTILLFSQNSFANPSRNLTVFAEPKMALALTKITRLYSQKSNTIVSTNFASAPELIASIDSGEPADVFISAHSDSIELIKRKGLADVHNVGYVAKNGNIFYQALVIAGDNMEVAREFLKFLKSDVAKTILKEIGFGVD